MSINDVGNIFCVATITYRIKRYGIIYSIIAIDIIAMIIMLPIIPVENPNKRLTDEVRNKNKKLAIINTLVFSVVSLILTIINIQEGIVISVTILSVSVLTVVGHKTNKRYVYDGINENPTIKDINNPNGNERAYNEICEIAGREYINIDWYEKAHETMDNPDDHENPIYINKINMECPVNIENDETWNKCVISNARSGYPFAMGLGEWGVQYSYKIRIKNMASKNINIKVKMLPNDSIYVKEKGKEASLMEYQKDTENTKYILQSSVNENEIKDIEFSVMSMVGKAGIKYQVIVEKQEG